MTDYDDQLENVAERLSALSVAIAVVVDEIGGLDPSFRTRVKRRLVDLADDTANLPGSSRTFRVIHDMIEKAEGRPASRPELRVVRPDETS
jgi:hypothetical protein